MGNADSKIKEAQDRSEKLAIEKNNLIEECQQSLNQKEEECKEKIKEYEQALNSCKLALRGDGHWGRQGAALAWNNQGDVLFNLKRYQESLKSFEQAIAINHNCASAQRNRAVVLRQLHKMMQG